MFSIKGIFGYIFEGIKQSRPFTAIKQILNPVLKEIEQEKLLSAYHNVQEIIDKSKQIEDLFFYSRVDRALGTQSPWDWKHIHTMRAKIQGYDAISQGFVEQYVTVGSEHILTKEEWYVLLEEAGSSLFGRYDISVKSISEFQYFIRNR